MTRSFGVKIVLRHVDSQIRKQRAEWWDRELGITGHGGDSGGGVKSEYYRNLMKINQAQVDGLDPYDFQAWMKELNEYWKSKGIEPHVWTPKLPEVKLGSSLTFGGSDGQNSRKKTRGKPRSRGTPKSR